MRFPDGLRAIAAMVVILPHATGLFTYWPVPGALTRTIIAAAHFGSYGVQIFFVLSGFVIAYTLRDQKLSPKYIAKFILRRSIRLDPPYWAAIAMFIVFLAIQRHIGNNPPAYPTAGKLLAHLFYIQDILGYGNINVVFWTLCIEIQFYIVLCLLIWSVQSFGTRAARDPAWRGLPFLIFFALSLAWPAGLLHGGLFRGSFLPHWFGFLAGAVVWWTIGQNLPRITGYVAIGVLWIVLAARFDVGTLTVALTATSLLAASKTGNLYTWLDVAPFQFLGRISYCIYLVHVPIVGMLAALQTRIAPRCEFVTYLIFASYAVITIAVAYAMHQIVEVPAMHWSKLIKPGNATPKDGKIPVEISSTTLT